MKLLAGKRLSHCFFFSARLPWALQKRSRLLVFHPMEAPFPMATQVFSGAILIS